MATTATITSGMETMEVDSLELEEITLVGGQQDHLLEGGPQGHRLDWGQGQRERRGHRDREGHRGRHTHGHNGPRDDPRRSRHH